MIVDLFAPAPAVVLPFDGERHLFDGRLVNVSVSVTSEDIAHGTHACSNCPIARALARALPGAERIDVPSDRIVVYLRDSWTLVYRSAEPIETFVIRYDTGEPVHPFTFEIEVPECAVKGGAA